MKKDSIKITIEGYTGSGKTILANVLKEFVEKHGIKCKISDVDGMDISRNRLPRNWRSQFKYVKKNNDLVAIRTVQAIRHSL